MHDTMQEQPGQQGAAGALQRGGHLRIPVGIHERLQWCHLSCPARSLWAHHECALPPYKIGVRVGSLTCIYLAAT